MGPYGGKTDMCTDALDIKLHYNHMMLHISSLDEGPIHLMR